MISKAMVIGWIQLALGALAIPQLIALVPEAYLPWVACVTGILVMLFRWLNGGLGVNPLSIVGVLTVLGGILSIPEFVAVIPLTWTPVLTVIGAILTLVSRYIAGQTGTDPAKAVNFLMQTP